MSERVVRMDAHVACGSHNARYDRGEDVDRAVDSGWIAVLPKEEDSSGDGSCVRPTQV
jgi:hypothetical protein